MYDPGKNEESGEKSCCCNVGELDHFLHRDKFTSDVIAAADVVSVDVVVAAVVVVVGLTQSSVFSSRKF